MIQACNPPVIFWPFAMAFRALEGTRFVFDHHDLRPGLYGFRFPASPRLPYHGSRAFERRTHRAAGYVISTNDSCREIAMRPRVGQVKDRRAELTQFVGAIMTGAPMPIPVGSLVATTRATIAVGESLLSGSSERV